MQEFQTFLTWLVDTISSMGYPGIIILMFIESTFIPLPSELVIPPAGYLISQNQMSWVGVILSGTFGSLMGALFNYAIAVFFGRPFILRYGKYFGISQKHFTKGEIFFQQHGTISTFIGRLILGVRHYISFPAGLARMHIGKFCCFWRRHMGNSSCIHRILCWKQQGKGFGSQQAVGTLHPCRLCIAGYNLYLLA
jgi:membrane protein DedA with SNARE-associated domain